MSEESKLTCNECLAPIKVNKDGKPTRGKSWQIVHLETFEYLFTRCVRCHSILEEIAETHQRYKSN